MPKATSTDTTMAQVSAIRFEPHPDAAGLVDPRKWRKATAPMKAAAMLAGGVLVQDKDQLQASVIRLVVGEGLGALELLKSTLHDAAEQTKLLLSLYEAAEARVVVALGAATEPGQEHLWPI